MKNWDQDDAYEFPGDHYVITNGYDIVVDQLVQRAKDVGVEFKLGKFTTIAYSTIVYRQDCRGISTKNKNSTSGLYFLMKLHVPMQFHAFNKMQ